VGGDVALVRCPEAKIYDHGPQHPLRPQRVLYTWSLIEACGLKGRAVGGARISLKHANFIVNERGARAADIEALILLAEKAVREKFGIALEREVRIVGDA